MNDLTTEELSMIIIMGSAALVGKRITFTKSFTYDTFLSVQRKVADELERRESEEEEGDAE